MAQKGNTNWQSFSHFGLMKSPLVCVHITPFPVSLNPARAGAPVPPLSHHQEGDADPGAQRMMFREQRSRDSSSEGKGTLVISDRTLMWQVGRYFFFKHFPWVAWVTSYGTYQTVNMSFPIWVDATNRKIQKIAKGYLSVGEWRHLEMASTTTLLTF